MKHYTLLKLVPGADVEDVQHRILRAYQKIDGTLDWANFPVVYRSCCPGADSYDIMAEMDLEGAEQLDAFLNDEHYRKAMAKIEDAVASVARFAHY